MGTPATPVKKTSWLKKFGVDVVHALEKGGGVAMKIEQAAEKPIEVAVPATIPVFDLIDATYEEVKIVEATFNAVGQASNSAGMGQAAVIQGISSSC